MPVERTGDCRCAPASIASAFSIPLANWYINNVRIIVIAAGRTHRGRSLIKRTTPGQVSVRERGRTTCRSRVCLNRHRESDHSLECQCGPLFEECVILNLSFYLASRTKGHCAVACYEARECESEHKQGKRSFWFGLAPTTR